MSEAIRDSVEVLRTHRGAEALASFRDLARAIGELSEASRDELDAEATGDLCLAMALAASDELDRAQHAGRLAERAEPDLRPDPARRGLVALMLGVGAFHAGDFRACHEACAAGLRRLGNAELPLLRAELLAQQAVASKHLGHRDDALAQNLSALDVAARSAAVYAVEVRATLHNNIGVLFLAQGDADAGVRHLERALQEAAGRADLEAFRAMVHLNVGRLMLRGDREDLSGASEHFEHGSALASTLGSETAQLRAHQGLAMVRRRQGRLQESLALLEPLLERWQAATAPMVVADLLLSRGRTRQEMGRADADQDLMHAFELAEQSDSFDLMLQAAQALTDFMESRGRFEEACSWHRRRHDLERVQFDREKSARMQEMQARHQVEQAEHELREARDRAETANRAKTSFLAVTSHELRTPLNGILGYTELLLDDVADGFAPSLEDLGRDLGSVHASARRLQRLIDRILALTSFQEGQATVVPEPVAIALCIETVLAPLRASVQQRGNELVAELHPSLEGAEPMHTDPKHLQQVLTHLVDNAAAFTESGRITVAARRDVDTLVLEVRDTGIGFEPAMLDQLLQPFQQTDMSYTRDHEGLGLGLTLCRYAIDLLGGTLSADSRPGRGATFRVQLPWRVHANPTDDEPTPAG